MNKRVISGTIGKFVLFVYALTCFLQAQTLKFKFGTIDIAFNRIVIVLFVLNMFFSYVISFESKKSLPYFKGNFYYRFLLIWLVWQVVNLPMGLSRGGLGWVKLTWLIFIFLSSSFILRKYIISLEMMYKLLGWLQVGALGQIIIGLYEHYTGIYHWTSNKELYAIAIFFQKKKYPCAMQENPNDFAVLMYFAVLISFVLLKVSKGIMRKSLSLIIIAVGLFLIFISDSRSVLLGVLVAIGYYFIPSFIKQEMPKKLVVWIITIVPFIIAYVLANMDSVLSKLQFDLSGRSESDRLILFFKGLENVRDSMGIGTGSHDTPYHNFAIEVLAESGVIVFICFIIALWSVYKQIKYASLFSANKSTKVAADIFRVGFVGYLITTVSPASSLNIEWLGLMVGIFAVFGTLAKKEMEKNKNYEI